MAAFACVRSFPAAMRFLMRMRLLGSFILAIIMLGPAREAPAQAAKFSALYNFGTNTGDPEEPLPPGIISQGRDGNLYSTTYIGGSARDGTVFRITPTGKLTVLYNFDGTQGVNPSSGLSLGTDGKSYGAASLDGAFGYGTLFTITPSGALTTLYDFTGGGDGGFPSGPLIQGTNGNFYGTINVFGKFNCGTVYQVTRSGKLNTLHDFNRPQGCNPSSHLILGSDGNLNTYSQYAP